MNYATIKNYDIANGLGVRVSLFVSGCTHHCKNCFNAIAWDFNYGNVFTKEVEDDIIASLKQPMITGLSLLGGEPMEPQNQRGLYEFLKRVKKEVPDKDIWCYTGYTLETDLLEGKVHLEITDEILSMIDVLVDGKFVEELKDITLKFRGSSNQRVIDLKRTLATNQVAIINFD
ncbi:MAG: anaerobic ribonucleoside-triphosphate reductase activating protein [Anaeroplasmataceae bacterium]|nr:anaerobic ribonucleoside-triphosphate reductase activating protein [Anaeroplasmataceae bacterium]